MDGPDASILLEVSRDLRMPVLGEGHEGPRLTGPGDLLVSEGHDLLSIGHVKASVDIGEVVLDVHDDKGALGVEFGHALYLTGRSS
jgi:hypothetical protein